MDARRRSTGLSAPASAASSLCRCSHSHSDPCVHPSRNGTASLISTIVTSAIVAGSTAQPRTSVPTQSHSTGLATVPQYRARA
eukprot:3396657-Rhodomonas_salina.2